MILKAAHDSTKPEKIVEVYLKDSEYGGVDVVVRVLPGGNDTHLLSITEHGTIARYQFPELKDFGFKTDLQGRVKIDD